MSSIREDPHARWKKERQALLIPKEQRKVRRKLPPSDIANNVRATCKRWGSTAVNKDVDQQLENAKRLEQQLCAQEHRDKMRKQGVQTLTSRLPRFRVTGMVTKRPGIRKTKRPGIRK